jgi:hypothetical protein
MKKSLLAVSLASLACMPLKASEPHTIAKVITVDSTMNKEAVFVSVNSWFATRYNSSNDVIQMSDKDAGVIIGKALMEVPAPNFSLTCSKGVLNYTIKAQCRDGRFRVEVSNVIHASTHPNAAGSCSFGLLTTDEIYKEKGMGKNAYNEAWRLFKFRIDKYAEELFNDIEQYVKTSTPSTSNEAEW